MTWEKTVFDGLGGYTVVSNGWRLTAISQCGPRIAFLGRDGEENLLYWDLPGVERGSWKLRGGHRVWLSRPMADESEDTYLSDNEPCTVEMEGDTLILTAPPHPVHHLSRGMRIAPLEGGRFCVVGFVRNDGDLIYSGGVWTPTCINPTGKRFRIPLGDDASTWDVVKLVIPRVFAGNVSTLEDDSVYFEHNDLIAVPKGRVCKRCVCAPKGDIVMTWAEKGITFRKHSDYNRHLRYPLDGCNLALFIGKDNWMSEMESFGGEQSIIPGETIENVEWWELAQ